MRLLLIPLLCSLASVSVSADITGVWNTDNNESQITIEQDPTNQTYKGVITFISDRVGGDPDEVKTDIQNPDPERRNDPLIGLTLMQGFKKVADKNKYTQGRIYDPKSGKTYKCTLTEVDADTLSVRGFIGVSLVGRSTTWTRAVDE